MREAWGKWGATDEAGALNLIGRDEIFGALATVRRGVAMPLGQVLSPKTPVPPHRPGIQHFMSRDGGDYAAGGRRPGGFQFAEDTMVLPTHVGTHIDALCHCWYDDTIYNGFAANEIRSSGAARGGVDRMPPIVTRGVLLDFVALAGRPLEDGEVIGPEMVRGALGRAGATLRDGDAVLLRTGWLERPVDGQRNFTTEPGIDVEAGLLLARAGVALVGADNYAIEVLPFTEGQVFPVHQRLIRDFGIPLLEGLTLAPLARTGVTQFLLVVAPLGIAGGTASPVNPVAIL